MRDSFIFYRSFYEAIRELPRDVQGEIYTSVMEYGLYGKETEQLKPIARSIFSLIKPQIDINNIRYENGKKGGAPKGVCNNPLGRNKTNQEQTKKKPKKNQKQTKNKPNVNDNVNVNDIIPPITCPPLGETESDFEKFWDMYGKKVGNKEKLKIKFSKLPREDCNKIFATLPAYVASTPDKKYRKNPETYLNNRGWEDEIIDANGSDKNNDRRYFESSEKIIFDKKPDFECKIE